MKNNPHPLQTKPVILLLVLTLLGVARANPCPYSQKSDNIVSGIDCVIM